MVYHAEKHLVWAVKSFGGGDVSNSTWNIDHHTKHHRGRPDAGPEMVCSCCYMTQSLLIVVQADGWTWCGALNLK